MRPTSLASLALGFLAIASLAAGPASAFGLGEAAEAEAARHNARAGGPTNDRDRELLIRYGCFSDTDSQFCNNLERNRRHKLNRRHRAR